MARNKKKLPGLNASSMSDISFLLLTFFLLVSSINTDMGIQRRLPPPSDPNVKPPDIHRRNTFVVLVNKDDKLLFNGELGEINLLKERAKEFLSNPDNLANLPEKITKDIPLLGTVEVSKGVISLQNDRGTSYEMSGLPSEAVFSGSIIGTVYIPSERIRKLRRSIRITRRET